MSQRVSEAAPERCGRPSVGGCGGVGRAAPSAFWERVFVSALVLAAVLCWPPLAAAGRGLPNLVIILVDDLGYADIGPFGAKGDETPNLDRMAREGRIFTDFYVPRSTCSASRAGLLTGCYSVRVGIEMPLAPGSEIGIDPKETTLAELVKQKGYATACYGKWHLGHHPKFLPTKHGFDDFFGLPFSNDMTPALPLIDGTRVVHWHVVGEEQNQLTAQYTHRALRFIENHKDGPFSLYLPHTLVHVPLHVSDRFRGKSKRGLYGDAVMEMDWSVGQILDTLRRLGLDRRTMVIFTSDNGPWLSFGDHAGSAGPLREGKRSTFEGGCRVPTVMWWPGVIPAGSACSVPAMTIDILPTMARLTGAKLPDRRIDGKDIWPLIAGEPNAKSPHEAYFFYWRGELQAVRMGKWKLHFPHKYQTLSGRRGGEGGKRAPYDQREIGLALFDLENDIGETTDVADQHPEVVAKIQQLANRMRLELGDSLTGQIGWGVRGPGRLEKGEARFRLRPPPPLKSVLLARVRQASVFLLHAAPVVVVLLGAALALGRSRRQRLANVVVGLVGASAAAFALIPLSYAQPGVLLEHLAMFAVGAAMAGAVAAVLLGAVLRRLVARRASRRNRPGAST